MAESRPTITAALGATALKVAGGNFRLEFDEPSSFQLELHNGAGDYNPDAAIANPRTLTDRVIITVVKGGTYNSPSFIVEDYDYGTSVAVVSGRCILSLLDRNDQHIDVGDGTSTLENTTLAAALSLIGAAYGVTFSGVPTRNLAGPYHLVGNPLQWVRDLIGPTHVIRAGTGTTILVESATTHSTATAITADNKLEILTFKRTSEVYNKATVERLVETTGEVELYKEVASGGTILQTTTDRDFSEPSRTFSIRENKALRAPNGALYLTLLDEEGDPVAPYPFTLGAYTGLTEIHGVRYYYDLDTRSPTWPGAWTPNLHLEIVGYPLEVSPVPTEGYSETATVGAGDRPYPEPFSSLLIDDATTAQAAAQALADRGSRIGNVLNANIRLTADLPLPNQEVDITDDPGLSGIDETVLVESVEVSWSPTDTGTTRLECSISEAA